MGAGIDTPAGIWRIELPLPVNVWALAAGDGVVLVDAGFAAEGALQALTSGLADAGFALSDVRRVVCTHAHGDHIGLAAPITEAAGCELWMHADHRHGTLPVTDIEAEVGRRLQTGRRCGVPEDALAAYASALCAQDLGVAGTPRATRTLADGDEIDTDAGVWRVVETPGHAPSHVCLFEPDAGLLISGDVVLERPSLGLDHGWTPDPVGELLRSLDRVEALGARLVLPGHGAPFHGAQAAIAATRAALRGRIDAVGSALAAGARTPAEVAERALESPWMFVDALAILEHLERSSEALLEAPLRFVS